MRKILFLIAVVSLSLGTIFTTNTVAQDNIEKTHFKMDLNQQMTADSNKLQVNQIGMNNSIGRGAEQLPASFVDLSLDLRDIQAKDYKMASGHGVVKVGTDTFPFTLDDQQYPMFKLQDGSVVHIGGLTGIIHTKNGDSMLTLGMEYIPTTNKAFISTYIGELSETTGLGIMRFGQPVLTKAMGEEIEQIRAEERLKNTNSEGSAQE
ncbi:MAG: hypothetical protein ACXVP5_08880 [Tumebacillaceae bacterium]